MRITTIETVRTTHPTEESAMPIVMKPLETYRDDFTFSNSPEAIARFPFPFPEDSYMYSCLLYTSPTPRDTR